MKWEGDTLKESVLIMAVLRMFSGSAEILAALLMLYFNDPKKALVMNGMLAFIGPTVLIISMSIGVMSVANELSFLKIVFLLMGISCILIAVFK